MTLTMAVRTFTTPTSLNETMATSQPPLSDTKPSVKPVNGHPVDPKAKAGITYASQDKLPKLPIPELESTCKKYREVLAPLQTRREQHETAAAVQEFLKGDGPELQERLKRYATGKTSYIEQFCEYSLEAVPTTATDFQPS